MQSLSANINTNDNHYQLGSVLIVERMHTIAVSGSQGDAETLRLR